MIKSFGSLTLAFSMLAATAQTPTASQTAYQGQSWVGLLVAGSCDKTGKDQTKSKRESDLTVGSRTTTPAVDDSGTRGSAEHDASQSTQKQSMPETGDVTAKAKATDPGWGPARKQAQSLGASCTVDANTMKFALMLPDGALLAFDELANQAIAKQLPSLPSGVKNRKILRVSVQGKMQNGKIALDTIQM